MPPKMRWFFQPTAEHPLGDPPNEQSVAILEVLDGLADAEHPLLAEHGTRAGAIDKFVMTCRQSAYCLRMAKKGNLIQRVRDMVSHGKTYNYAHVLPNDPHYRAYQLLMKQVQLTS